jgi:multimeric flavodoxin WrbA/putative sterol carrier protein
MKRIANTLPHVIITAYITALSIGGFRSLGLEPLSLVALFLTGFILYLSREGGGISPVSKAYLLYFIINAIAYWALPESINHLMTTTPTALLYGSLCAVAVVPALFGKQYFTEYFARKTTPRAVWRTDIFKRINRNMSWVWVGIFVACVIIAIAPGLLSMKRSLLTSLAIQMGLPLLLMLGVGVPFNKRYPAYYQRKIGIEPVGVSKGGTDAIDAEPVASRDHKNEEENVMSNQFKIVAVNGSPHTGIGNTSMMVQMMKPALAEEGIDLEQIFLADKRIEYCVGCGVCLEKGKCWRQDDHGEIIDRILAADGLILASPVYFKHVTAQMKAFIDRSLGYGHKPRTTWKPGMVISVSAGMGETTTADYLAGLLRVYGAFSIGRLTAIATGPGAFLGMDLVEARAKDLAFDLARTIKEKRRYPVTENDLFFYLFMRDLVEREKDFMRDDYKHWQESGFLAGFEAYVGQRFTTPAVNPELRKEWIRVMISNEMSKTKGMAEETTHESSSVRSITSCRELLKMMPLGFKKEVAGSLRAVYQFEISGAENFTSHLDISDGRCIYVEGPHSKPDVIIKSPAEVWLAISKGDMDGQTAFMTGKYKVEGDLSLLLKLKNLFSS